MRDNLKSVRSQKHANFLLKWHFSRTFDTHQSSRHPNEPNTKRKEMLNKQNRSIDFASSCAALFMCNIFSFCFTQFFPNVYFDLHSLFQQNKMKKKHQCFHRRSRCVCEIGSIQTILITHGFWFDFYIHYNVSECCVSLY